MKLKLNIDKELVEEFGREKIKAALEDFIEEFGWDFLTDYEQSTTQGIEEEIVAETKWGKESKELKEIPLDKEDD
jgi:hypothetical protein